MTTYQIIDANPRFSGRCVCCHREARTFEAVLVRGDDKFAVAHQSCAGVSTKSKIGGGRVIVRGPESIEA